MTISLGVIETVGLTSAIHAADAACKAAGVQLTGYRKAGSGLVSIYLQGEISAVKAAVDCGLEAIANRSDETAAIVMARPDPSVLAMLENGDIGSDPQDPNNQGPVNGSPDGAATLSPTKEADIVSSDPASASTEESRSSAKSSESLSEAKAQTQAGEESGADNAAASQNSSQPASQTKTPARRQASTRRKKSPGTSSQRGAKQ